MAMQSLGISGFESADDNAYTSVFYRINQHEHAETPGQDVTRTTLSMTGALVYLARHFYKQCRAPPENHIGDCADEHELLHTYA